MAAAIFIADALANAQLDLIETYAGASPILKGWSGAALNPPGDSGTLLFTINLPADWAANAAARSKAMLGTWLTTVGVAAGTLASCCLYTAANAPVFSGKAGITGDATAVFTFPSLTTAVGLAVQINSFVLTR